MNSYRMPYMRHLAILLAGIAPLAVAAPVTFQKSVDGSALQQGQLAAALARGGVAIRLEADATTELYGIGFEAAAPSYVLASMSSELITLAVLEGQIRVGKEVVNPGQAAVTAIARPETLVSFFDAERLAASAAPGIAADVRAALQPVIAQQQKRRKWGYYTQGTLNTQLTSMGGSESLRRQYLTDPVVVQMRRDAAGDAKKLRELVAERFVSALTARDSAAIAALIDPAPFAERGNGWVEERRAYAGRLAGSALATEVKSAQIRPESADTFTVTAGARSYVLSTVERGGSVFVASLETAR